MAWIKGWRDDKRALEALKERSVDDVMLLDCPACGATSYYNQGSHFTCNDCGDTFYALADDEDMPPAAACVRIDDAYTVRDAIDAEDECAARGGHFPETDEEIDAVLDGE